MRPRCCLRYLTFFGINIVGNLWSGGSGSTRPTCPFLPSRHRSTWRALPVFLFAAPLGDQAFTFVQPHFDADLAVGGAGLGKPVIDVRPECLQAQLPVHVPLSARALGP